ncbi:hypothetical protein [Pseudomonas paralcaligenes]|uniref:hypothetical protein n=1 Tax=Pseudomonas paralcaligenes TaxID=2772558 RepID=UPI001C7EC744|nr:hypothetical protein [Pseudomonas paralcaligenes]
MTDQQLQAVLSAAYLFGLEDGMRMPMQGEAAAKQVVKMIRNEHPERVAGRVSFLLEKDIEANHD